MVRILRIVLAVVGVVLVIGSSTLTWVIVEVDTEVFGELAEGAVDAAAEADADAAELIDEAEEVIETARDLIPDQLLDATLNGQNAYDLFGLGFLLAGLAISAAVAVAIWALNGTRWLRWIGVLCAFALLVTTVLTPLSIFATDALLDQFLPEDWKPFSPSFDITTAPLGAIAGAVAIFVSLLGRSRARKKSVQSPPPPPPIADAIR